MFDKLNIFSKKNTRVILILTLLLLGVLSLLAYVICKKNLQEIEKITWEYWETGDRRRVGLVIQNSIKESRKREYTLTNFNLFNPTTTIILQYKILPSKNQDIQFETFYLKRTGLNSFEVKESVISTSTKYSFAEAVGLVKKFDVYKENPNKNYINNLPHLNLAPDEIQAEQEKQQQLENALKQIEKEKQYFDSLNKQEKIDFLQKSTEDASQDSRLDDMTRQAIFERNQILIQKLENGEEVTSKDFWAGMG